MVIKSNRYKCKNMPTDHKVNHVIKSKPVFAMSFIFFTGIIMSLSGEYLLIGAALAVMSGYTLFFTKNKVSIEFTDNYMIVYLNDQTEEGYLIYYNEVENYRYVPKMYQTDEVEILLINKKLISFKSLDRRRLRKYLKKYLEKK